jgi:hypothetical protein
MEINYDGGLNSYASLEMQKSSNCRENTFCTPKFDFLFQFNTLSCLVIFDSINQMMKSKRRINIRLFIHSIDELPLFVDNYAARNLEMIVLFEF